MGNLHPSGWEYNMPEEHETGAVHVYPVEDMIEHRLEGLADDCPCEPFVHWVDPETGEVWENGGPMVMHQSIDGLCLRSHESKRLYGQPSGFVGKWLSGSALRSSRKTMTVQFEEEIGVLIDPLEPEISENGLIVDFITGDLLNPTPEEHVRQRLQRLLHIEYGYPRNRIAREITIHYGGREQKDGAGNPVRADVGVFRTAAAAKKKDQGALEIVCETKRPKEEAGYAQLVSYVFNTSAEGAIWFNQDMRVWRRVKNKLDPWPTLPRPRERWDAVGRRKKSELLELKDPRGTIRRCHDRIHRRGVTEDVAITMVRLLLAKWRDEERPGEYTEFYCTPEEFGTPAGRQSVRERVEMLFLEVRDANPTVFDRHEHIGASADEVVEVVTELQHYRLLGDTDEQWDVMGAAYEQYTADEMKKEGGEFFTNRLVVDLLAKMVVVSPEGTMLDPAGGTGGFCTAVLRRTRRLIRESTRGASAQNRAIESLKNRIFLIDKKPRLVKLAKAAMIVSGNGHRGFIQADSLQPLTQLPPTFLQHCPPERVSLVMTNPPWSGLVNGRINNDPVLLREYEVAHRWEWNDDGQYVPTDDLQGGGIPPEYLFVERCIRWLAPGGTLAIVLPKGILDNLEPALAVRHYLFRYCQVMAVINCHKNTFQPYTGSRGCLIVAKKKKTPGDGRRYKIFMAINRKVGQDSEGYPVYKKDETGRPTRELDQDLDQIYEAWQNHLQGRLTTSEYTFSIDASSLDPKTLKLNPQFFLPSLNETLQRIISLDGNGFTVERLGDRIAARIWKGTWFKREDLEVDAPNENTVEYLTPSAVLMRGQGVKYFDLSKCTQSRKEEILRHLGREGEIVISRSGTIGRVTLVGRSLVGKVLSDDLIRVWIDDPALRALVFAFLRSPGGQDQLLRNEYGTVQQHLEPPHVADLQLPLPEDPEQLNAIMSVVKAAMDAREQSIKLEGKADSQMRTLLGWDES